MNIGGTLQSTSLKYPDKIAVIEPTQGITMTYKQLNKRVNQLAHALLDSGVHPGDRVAVLLKNCSQYVEIAYAAAKIGAIVVPLNFRLNENEIKFIVKDSDSKVLFFGPEYQNVVKSSLEDADQVCTILLDEQKDEFDFSYEQFLCMGDSNEPQLEVSEVDVYGILYTSGTTGVPKGVIHTHRSLIETATRYIIEAEIVHEDHTLVVSPLFHLSGLVALFPSIIKGAKLTMMKEYKPELFLKIISDYQITFSTPVPTMINKSLEVENLNRFDFTKLRLFLYGGSTISAQTLKRAIEVFQCEFLQGYGMTEGTPFLLLKPEDHLDAASKNSKLLASAGRPAILSEVKIVNESGKEVPTGEKGEIIARTPQSMKGYWNREVETQKTLKNNWLYTGDIGVRDENGYIYIVDRKKEMIISGRENIYPAEVEKVIEMLPEVLETAVIGTPNQEWGEQVIAFIVLKKGKSLSEKQVIDHCKRNLASYKKPSSVEILSELPRNASGKVLKNKLKEPYWENANRKI